MAERALESYHPQTFSQRHKIMVALRATGMPVVKIAEEMDTEATTVSKILGDPRAKHLLKVLGEQFIDQLTQETQEQIQAHSLEAFEKVLYLMRDAESERVQQTSAFDIMDRGGFKPKEQSVQTQIKVGASDVQRLINALEESKKQPEALEMVQDSSGVFKEADDVTSARK